eukprot:TRINITY_DN8556_c0_g1_i1.p1 TRINITY_DN8556_c0_g1~~TRINITY_DN8556_c0_g1_i1.p1  ORF type:complete len:238 (+),score=76.56 TRINITY_DN8556_c0_g1_i1:66-779(+)
MYSSDTPFREIRAVHTEDTVRVYQAYSDEIAEKAVAANSFEAPRAAGVWSAARMTWIKPSALWMAYRCGWSMLKDARQARVLALDVSRTGLEALLMQAHLSHGSAARPECKASPVVVQWDPERGFDPDAPAKQVLTRAVTGVRSIQIGLRGAGSAALLDPTFVRRITDVTSDFRAACKALQTGDVPAAKAALWQGEAKEAPLEVPSELRAVLGMDATPADDGCGGKSDAALGKEVQE